MPAPTVRPDDTAILRRALQYAGLGESPLPECDKQLLREWYDFGNQAMLAKVLDLLKRTGPVSVRIHGRLTDIALADGRDDLVLARGNVADRAARKALHEYDPGPRGATQLERSIGPPPSFHSSQAQLAESHRDTELRRLRERLEALERSAR